MTMRSSFRKFIRTDFEPEILPIIPVRAKLKPCSALSPEHLGRIPGSYLAGTYEWTALAGWLTHDADSLDLERWDSWQTPEIPVPVGLNTHRFNAFDIYSESAAIADALKLLITMCIGASAAVRLRHSSFRRALFYEHDQSTALIRKFQLAFRDSGGHQHAVEVLGAGYQAVIEGPHASGAMHYWRDGIGLIEGREKLGANKITGEMVVATMRVIGDWVDQAAGLDKVKLTLPTGSDRKAPWGARTIPTQTGRQ